MNYSLKRFLGDTPYSGYHEYLEELTISVLLQVRQYLKRSFEPRINQSGYGGSPLLGYEEVLQLINFELAGKDIEEDQELADWQENMLSRRDLTQMSRGYYPVDEIVHKLGQDEFFVFVLMISLMASLQKRYQSVFQFLHRDNHLNYPTLELCRRIYTSDEEISDLENYATLEGYLQELNLLFPRLHATEHPEFCELICDERLVDLVLGRDNGYTRGISLFTAEDQLEPQLYREKELEQVNSFLGEAEYPMFLLYGNRGIGKKHFLRHFAKANHTGILLLDIRKFVSGTVVELETVYEAVRLAARECILQTGPLAISSLELLEYRDFEQLLDYIRNEIKSSVQLIFLLLNAEQFNSGIQDLYMIELPDFTDLQRVELWKYYTREYELESALPLDSVANTFIITPGQMIGAIRQAALLSGGAKHPIQEKLLFKACYAQLDHQLAGKTSKVKTSFSWEDLKMPKEDKEILSDLCNSVRNKHIVLNEWNFSKVVPYGAGLTVLFAGPPGTGKTMAVQVIANELNMELYKIDLSQIFDKYVGETEKNIKQIFDQARKSNSILFFDEADAIFNKRLEATSSNDRFANVESSLLLQCIEEYSGISVLATNNYNSIDSAFIRRFKYYVLFREPEEQVRYEIWKAVIPKEAPLSNDVDLLLLAKQFQFTGAVIKNVILSAAYLAAEKQEPISILDILKSIKREMFKNNLVLTKEKLGSFGYLFEDLK